MIVAIYFLYRVRILSSLHIKDNSYIAVCMVQVRAVRLF